MLLRGVSLVVAQRAAMTLSAEEVRGLEHPAVQLQLLASVTNLVRLCGKAASSVSRQLLTILLQLKSDPKKTVCLDVTYKWSPLSPVSRTNVGDDN